MNTIIKLTEKQYEKVLPALKAAGVKKKQATTKHWEHSEETKRLLARRARETWERRRKNAQPPNTYVF